MRHSTRVRARPAKDGISAGAATEAKMLRVLADPAMLNKSVAEKAAKAGVSRATWYRHVKDSLFRARVNAACRQTLDEFLGPVLHALGTMASEASRDGHPDRKLYFELVGFTAEALAAHDQAGMAKADEELTDEELLACFEGQEHLLPPGLLRRIGKDPDAHLDRKPARMLPLPVRDAGPVPPPRSVFDTPGSRAGGG
jgi:hypothetical protein